MGTTDWAISLDTKDLVAPPRSEIGDDDDFAWPEAAVNPNIHSSCTKDHKAKILEAWNEAGEITKTGYYWTRWSKYQKALDTYIGKKSGQVPLIGIDHIWGEYFSKALFIVSLLTLIPSGNLKKHYHAHNGGGQRGVYAYFYCDVQKMPQKVQEHVRRKPCTFSPKKQSGTAAKTWRLPGRLWSEYYVLLCPWWLGDIEGASKYQSLSATEEEADGFPTLQKQIDKWGKAVRATTIYHETAHWQDISWPNCDANEMYKPEDIVSQSRNGGDEGYEFNLRNAHSWSLAAVAMWIMEQFDLSEPPEPSKPIPAKPPTEWSIDPDDPDSLDEDIWVSTVDESWFDPARVDPDEFSRLSQIGPGGNKVSDCLENGEFHSEEQCKPLCNLGDDSKCTKSGDRWKCTGCRKEATECNEGLHSDWDTCYQNCKNGLCSENAGEDGIRCGSCP
ncbi:hypothetical protein DHEL01_v211789 [Diaporthe helianthi]|uniref:Lysine-specific metallo-endopeptidase domain-containing protein n=1 Tax=Diaporthe helianthi TaxID=158607 RepID=A0A2P5HHU2_DIAHE|nr:hypothetical protein DHEL01_v211789 [Diaporthe helianthi]